MKLTALLTVLFMFSCGGSPPPQPGPHAPANTTDDDGYLVNVKSALVTPNIPAPYRCFDGFDPVHNPWTDIDGGYCETQSNNLNHTFTPPFYMIPVVACNASQTVPVDWAEFTTTVTYADTLPPFTNCSRVKLSYFNNDFAIYRLNMAGWHGQHARIGSTPAFTIRLTQLRVGPNRFTTYSNDIYVLGPGCAGGEPGCTDIGNPYQQLDQTIAIPDGVISLRFRKWNVNAP